MRKKSKRKDKRSEPSRPQRRWKLRPMRVVGLAAAVVLPLAGLYSLRRSLLASPPYSQTLASVRLARVPRWMTRDIALSVRADLQSALTRDGGGASVYEGSVARDVYDRAVANPWIASVKRVAKRADGTVLVEADYRYPVALVRSDQLPADRMVVVGSDGVVLPLPAHRVEPGALVIIGDVAGRPPAPGEKWDAADLAAGLRLLKLIGAKPYAPEITVIDVRNYSGRIEPDPREPHLRMYAQVGRGRRTDIRFGRFPRGDDFCVSPERKLAYLDRYYQANGNRLAGANSYLDLRYDKLHVSVN